MGLSFYRAAAKKERDGDDLLLATMRNESGVAPSHADFQKFFNLTPPSVNSMLIRLEQRGFIRRIPGKARAIELRIDPGRIPPLDRPFKF